MSEVKQLDVLFTDGASQIEPNKNINGLPNFVSGIVDLNLQGNQSHNLTFDIPLSFSPRSAVVSLALSDVYNAGTSNSLRFAIGEWSLSYKTNCVRVTVPVFVGDTDGYLRGISYFCVAIP